jgi:hypothetical protein
MTWVQAGTTSIVDLRPPLAERVIALQQHAAAAAPGRTAELARIRVEQLLGVGSGETLPPDLTRAEHAALAVVEQFIVDVHGLDDVTFAELAQFYSPEEQMGLLFHLALLDGFTKLHLVAADNTTTAPPS